MIAGVDLPDSGEVVTPRDYTISYSAQQPELNYDLTVLEQVFAGDAPILVLQREYEQALLELSMHPEDSDIQQNLFELQKEWIPLMPGK